jgi:hypothetical protein
MYIHKVLRVNYTSYDLRRCQDSVNSRTHADIMLPSPDNDPDHPYMFARVVGILHVNVSYGSMVKHKRMDILWVRWFGHNYKFKSGIKHRRLPRIGFVPDDQDPMAFINPSDVIRAVHIIPAYKYGRTDIYLGPSVARVASADACRATDDEDEDWVYYYVNMYAPSSLLIPLADSISTRFVDRDMWVRFSGEGGVGHHSNRAPATKPNPPRDVDADDAAAAADPAALAREAAASRDSTAEIQPDGDENDVEDEDEDEDEDDLDGEGEEGAEDEDENENDEPHLGPEDGEGPVDENDDL